MSDYQKIQLSHLVGLVMNISQRINTFTLYIHTRKTKGETDFINKLEIRSVERGICSIAETIRPTVSFVNVHV